MNTQRGFANTGILITVVLGLVVLGGGAYYVMQIQSPSPKPTENSLDTLPTASTQTTGTTATNSAPTEQVAQPVSSTYTSANLTASPVSGAAPLAVSFSGRIEVPNDQQGSAVIFFGDGASDIMYRKGPTLFSEEWSHAYSKPGEYDATLVLTSVSNVDSDIEVMKNPNYDKNVVVKKIHISVGSAARTISGTGFEATAPNSWKVNSQTNSYISVSLSSPDYIAKSQAEIMKAEMGGEAPGIVSRGAIIEVVPQGENPLSASIQDPAAYVKFRMEGSYSNKIENKEISLGGQPAWLLKTRRGDGTLVTTVSTVRNGKEFLITLHAANESSIDVATWNTFLASFKFR